MLRSFQLKLKSFFYLISVEIVIRRDKASAKYFSTIPAFVTQHLKLYTSS